MEQDLVNIFKEQQAKLPYTVVNYILSGTWKKNLERVMVAHDLTENQQNFVVQHFVAMIHGIEHPYEFTQELANGLGIPQAEVEEITGKIDKFIDSEVIDELLIFEMTDEVAKKAIDEKEKEAASERPGKPEPAREILPIKAKILDEIEHPVAAPAPFVANKMTKMVTMPSKEVSVGASTAANKPTVAATTQTPPTPAEQPPRAGPDPYREPAQ